MSQQVNFSSICFRVEEDNDEELVAKAFLSIALSLIKAWSWKDGRPISIRGKKAKNSQTRNSKKFLKKLWRDRIGINWRDHWRQSWSSFHRSTIKLHPRSGRQKVLAKASNKRPHFPQWPLLLGLFWCFLFPCSSLVGWLANGTVTSSPAWFQNTGNSF